MQQAHRRLSNVTAQVMVAPCASEKEMVANPNYQGPLAGIMVLDLTQMVSGPMAGQILGDQGADVIKVETLAGSPERGSARAVMSTPLCSLVNRNKRSLAIDLSKPRGLDAFKRLAAKADVVMQNFRPGVVDRMGIGYEELKMINSGLIFVSISGFGQAGPYSQKRVYDPIVQAVSGLASIQADETGRPRMMRLIVPDKLTAVTASQAVTAALVQKLRTGMGSHIELSMLDAVVSFEWGEAFGRQTFVIPGDEPTYPWIRDMVYETKDGYVTVGAVQDKEWAGLCKALKKPEWLTDPRFKDGAARNVNRAERFQVQAEEIAKYTSQEILDSCNASDVPNGPVNHPREKVLADPQVVSNELIFRTTHPHAPFQLRQPRPAAQFSSSPFELMRHAPLLGEHSREVLQGVGLSDSELQELFDNKVVLTTAPRLPDAKRTDVKKLGIISG